MGYYPPGQKKKIIINFLIWFGMFILLIPVMYYFASHASNAGQYTTEDNLLGASIVAFFALIGLYGIYKLIRFGIRRPAWGISILVILLVFPVAGAIFYYLTYSQNKAIAGIQTNLNDIAAAKLSGNTIVSKGKASASSLADIGAAVTEASGKLIGFSAPAVLKNYQAAAILWSVRISSAVEQPSDWKGLKNQPDDFPITLTDTNVKEYFSASIKTIEDLKKSGEEAIQNKDREAMRQIAAKLLVQSHWLNAILHSQNNSTAFNLTSPVFAAAQDLQVPSVGQGVDVTCSVCDYPDAYKVHWTDKLRQQYGCDTRCRPKTTSTQGQTVTEEQTKAKDEAAKYADALASYTYKDVPKRAICIGNNAGGVFCVEEAVQLINEIAASAVGFAESTKALSVNQWNNEYQDIDVAILPVDTTGEAPSTPSANDGHKEGGMGTISTGEPIVAPKPKTPAKTPAPKGIWDGTYDFTGTCVNVRHSDYYSWSTPDEDQITVENNVINPVPSEYVTNDTFNANIAIDANGHAGEKSERTAPDGAHISEKREFQFTQAGSSASVQELDDINFTNLSDPWDQNCTLTGKRR